MSWGETGERVGLSLPEDYKRLAAVFGKGLFSGFLQILLASAFGRFQSYFPNGQRSIQIIVTWSTWINMDDALS
ncbi:hypothetical protein [Streptomyces sp. GESEQ-35]|uniref:hypothetical protein n=1 Tax=Streptomyces sp. GESEQ-35 TaxID=2812657 RepID=UPI001B341D6D|nr:hypothetical protein [Streptomyces sp. GESEQ-35]